MNLLVDGILAAARDRPTQQFEWTHFGDGTGKRSLEKRIQKLPENVHAHLAGHLPNHEIMSFYKEHCVDVFVNTSETEGGAPVSIQEAISCGIPVIATSVGGNPEIVSRENGILVSSDPEPREIANAFFRLIDDPQEANRKRADGRKVWQERYNAAINSAAFAARLQAIREST
jgi:glycosyltransferase involved in cell wall biosynthesis